MQQCALMQKGRPCLPSAPVSLPFQHPACTFARPQTEPLRSKALSFTSTAGTRGVQERSVESDVLVAEVAPQVLSHLQALLAELYIPLVASQQPARRQAESAKDEFVQVGPGWRAVCGRKARGAAVECLAAERCKPAACVVIGLM